MLLFKAWVPDLLFNKTLELEAESLLQSIVYVSLLFSCMWSVAPGLNCEPLSGWRAA